MIGYNNNNFRFSKNNSVLACKASPLITGVPFDPFSDSAPRFSFACSSSCEGGRHTTQRYYLFGYLSSWRRKIKWVNPTFLHGDMPVLTSTLPTEDMDNYKRWHFRITPQSQCGPSNHKATELWKHEICSYALGHPGLWTSPPAVPPRTTRGQPGSWQLVPWDAILAGCQSVS